VAEVFVDVILRKETAHWAFAVGGFAEQACEVGQGYRALGSLQYGWDTFVEDFLNQRQFVIEVPLAVVLHEQELHVTCILFQQVVGGEVAFDHEVALAEQVKRAL
jgi:hypothetical protein